MSENEKTGKYIGLTVPVERTCYMNMINTIKRQRRELKCWRIAGLTVVAVILLAWAVQ